MHVLELESIPRPRECSHDCRWLRQKRAAKSLRAIMADAGSKVNTQTLCDANLFCQHCLFLVSVWCFKITR